MNNEHNPFDPSLQKSNPGFGHSSPVSTIRTAVYKKCWEQWLRKIEDQVKQLAEFEAGCQRFKDMPDAQGQRWTNPEEHIRELGEGLAEVRMEMYLDLEDIKGLGANGLSRRLEWGKTVDQLDVQMPDPHDHPGWCFDRRDEINQGQVLLSGMTWPASRMPARRSVGAGASTSKGSERQSGNGGGRSRFPPGPDSPEGSSFPVWWQW